MLTQGLIRELGMLVFKERGKPEEERTNNKLNPHMMLGPGIESGPNWWG